jgi:hypothetical protein
MRIAFTEKLVTLLVVLLLTGLGYVAIMTPLVRLIWPPGLCFIC